MLLGSPLHKIWMDFICLILVVWLSARHSFNWMVWLPLFNPLRLITILKVNSSLQNVHLFKIKLLLLRLLLLLLILVDIFHEY